MLSEAREYVIPAFFSNAGFEAGDQPQLTINSFLLEPGGQDYVGINGYDDNPDYHSG
jgi:hypothetical protein